MLDIKFICLDSASFSEKTSPYGGREAMEWWIKTFQSLWKKSVIWRRTSRDRQISVGSLCPSAGSGHWRKVWMYCTNSLSFEEITTWSVKIWKTIHIVHFWVKNYPLSGCRINFFVNCWQCGPKCIVIHDHNTLG